MRKEKIGDHEIVFYESIDELPIQRYHHYNKYLIIDANIGSDTPSLMARAERALRFINSSKLKDASLEIDNLRQSIAFIENEVSPSHLSFAVLIKSIDGVDCDDISPNGLQETIKKLSERGATHGWFSRLLQSAKKKIEDEMILYFPELTSDGDIKEYYNLLKEHTDLTLQNIIDNDGKITEELDNLTGLIIMFTPAQQFYGSDSVEVKYDKQFERMCIFIRKKTGLESKAATTMEYFEAFCDIKDEARKERKGQSRNNRGNG